MQERYKPSLQDLKPDFLLWILLTIFPSPADQDLILFIVLKLLKMATGMRALLDTVVQALPQVSSQTLSMLSLFPLADYAFWAWGQLCATVFGGH